MPVISLQRVVSSVREARENFGEGDGGAPNLCLRLRSGRGGIVLLRAPEAADRRARLFREFLFGDVQGALIVAPIVVE